MCLLANSGWCFLDRVGEALFLSKRNRLFLGAELHDDVSEELPRLQIDDVRQEVDDTFPDTEKDKEKGSRKNASKKDNSNSTEVARPSKGGMH